MTKQIDWKNTLNKTYLFQGLSEDELNLVQQITEARTYSRGEHLFSQNEEPDAIYVIRYGSVQSEAFGPENDHEYGYGVLGAGSVLGEVSFQSLSPRATSATAIEDVEAIRISFSALKKVMDSNLSLSVKVYQAMTRHLGRVFHKSISDLTRLRGRAYSHERH
jgi:CRP/FNR family transcriptional regulator, dissimilatory nitrate respiration regulator